MPVELLVLGQRTCSEAEAAEEAAEKGEGPKQASEPMQ